MNGRLFLSLIGVMFAGYAVLWDWFYPYPASRTVLIVCAVSYFIVSGILTLYIMFKVCASSSVITKLLLISPSTNISWLFIFL